jgi:hypothetical protein
VRPASLLLRLSGEELPAVVSEGVMGTVSSGTGVDAAKVAIFADDVDEGWLKCI